jgi:5-methyltetrahydrofolate--homocysteine methyltransferase
MIQALKLNEEGYRGARFDAWNREVRGNNDLLNLSRPDAVRDIHLAYFRAGADIVSTNTFSSTTVAQADYGMEGIAYELNQAGATLAREAAAQAEKEDGRRRFVAGALGPTNRTASISPDVANPGFRAITFDQLRTAYGEQVHGLIDGGADLLLIETIFDTLNAKAAIYAISEVCDERGLDVPVMISGTITDRRTRNARTYCGVGTAGRYLRVRLSECRPAKRVWLLRRKPRLYGGAPRRICRGRIGQCCRRLLRHYA